MTFVLECNNNHMKKGGGKVEKEKECECECKLCGYKWEPRVDSPRVCPRCKRHDWNDDKGDKK